MKTMMKSIMAIAVMLIGFTGLQAQNDVKKEEFKVYGNCGMCESRIEKAAEGVDGVSSADWDKETKMITVNYNPDMVEMMDVHKAIAAVGHDTEKVEARDKTYEGLPGCCKYDRKEHKGDDDHGHDGHKH